MPRRATGGQSCGDTRGHADRAARRSRRRTAVATEPHPTSTWARCPGCRARSTRRSRAVSTRSPRSRRTPTDATALKHARTHVHQAAGAIQMVGLDAVVAFTDEIERQLARLEDAAARSRSPTAIDDRRSRVPQAAHLPRRARQRRDAGPAEAVPRVRGDAARARREGRRRRPISSIPDLSPRAPRIAPREPIAADRSSPSYLVKQRRALPARPARVAARRARGREGDARRDRRHRGRDVAGQPALVLVDGRRAASRR